MIGASVYVPAPASNIGALASYLRIPEANMAAYDAVRPNFDFYTREENSMTFAQLGGDFGFLCDVDLFHMTYEDLVMALRSLSATGLVLATPNEESEVPDDCLLFESGVVKKVQIRKDDVLDEVRIVRSRREEFGA